MARKQDGLCGKGENTSADGLKCGAVAGADATDRSSEDHVSDNGHWGFQTFDLINRSADGVAWNGMGGDGEGAHLESFGVGNRLATLNRFGFWGKRRGFGLFANPVEFQDMIPVGMSKKDFSQDKFVAGQSGKKGIGIGSRIKSDRLEGFGIPDEVVIHSHVGEGGGKF